MPTNCDRCGTDDPLVHYGSKPNGDWNWRCEPCTGMYNRELTSLYSGIEGTPAQEAPKTRPAARGWYGGEI